MSKLPPNGMGTMPSDGSEQIRLTLPAWRSVMPKINMLVFDLEGVLLDDSVWFHWMLQQLSRIGFHVDPHALSRAWRHDYVRSIRRGDCDWETALLRLLQSVGLSSGQAAELRAAVRGRRRRLIEQCCPFPGVIRTLRILKKCGMEMALFSTTATCGRQVQSRLESLHLRHYFSRAVAAWQRRRETLDESGFATFLQECGAVANESVYVGYDAVELRLAHSAGLVTMAINCDPDSIADIHLACVTHIPRYVSRRVRRQTAA